jgi:hypothetical protein
MGWYLIIKQKAMGISMANIQIEESKEVSHDQVP